MIADIALVIIAVTLVMLVVLFVVALVQMRKMVSSSKRDLHHVSTEAIELMQRVEALTSDLKAKSESLNCLFRPLKSLNKEHKGHVPPSETAMEVVDWVATSLVLFNKIRTYVKHYEK